MANQRNNGWQADIKIDGKRLRKMFDSKREAEAWEAAVRLAHSRGEAVQADGPITSQSFSAYIKRIHPVLWEDNNHGNKVLGQLKELQDILKDKPVSLITDVDIEDILLELRERNNSNATINRKLAALSKVLRQAHKTGVLERTPHLPRQKESVGRIRFLTQDEEHRLVSSLRFMREDHADFLEFLIDTGMRVGEALKFTWEDLGEGSVTLWETKNNRSRTIPLTQRAKASVGRSNRQQRYVFEHINRYGFRTSFDRARDHAGLGKDVIPHVMRHTCASRLVQGGVDIRRVQVWLGHTTIAMTMRYSHLAPKDLEVCVAALEK